MTRILLWSVATGLSMLALLSGCRSITPPVVYYTIHPIDGEIAAMDADGAPAVRIGIRSVELPGTVNRTQMVRLSGANRVLISSFNRWADYPDRLVQRVIDQNLSLLLPDAHVVSAPWPVGFQPDVIVSFQFIELIAAADQTMRLDVAWSVRAKGDEEHLEAHRRSISEPIYGSGFDELAAAHSRVLETLCRAVAGTLGRTAAP